MNDQDVVELWVRKRVTINTDPQRRCYDGCNFSERTQWGEWELLGPYRLADAESSAATFKEINPDREYEIRWRVP